MCNHKVVDPVTKRTRKCKHKGAYKYGKCKKHYKGKSSRTQRGGNGSSNAEVIRGLMVRASQCKKRLDSCKAKCNKPCNGNAEEIKYLKESLRKCVRESRR